MRKTASSVALLGPEGTFSSYALKKIPLKLRRLYCPRISAVLKAVDRGAFGFLPVRNKIVGSIVTVTSHLVFGRDSRYQILRKVRLPIRLALVAQKKLPLRDIRTIYCVQAAVEQCRLFLNKHLSSARIVGTYDSNGEVYKKIVQLSGKAAETSAAIGPQKSAKLFGLAVLAKDIQDDANDWTEFVLFWSKKQTDKNPPSQKRYWNNK